MITSFFKTSKPIHFVIVCLMALGLFIYFRVGTYPETLTFGLIAYETLMFGVLGWALGVLVFFVNKNQLTQNNSYKLFLILLFLAMIPSALQNDAILWSNMFVMLALRRIISLKSKMHVKKKLFDAAFWITIATLCYFWSALFFILIVMALIVYGIEDLKNWFVPLIGIGTVILLFTAYQVVVKDTLGDWSVFWTGMDIDFTSYNTGQMILAITLLGALGLWASVYYIKQLNDKTRSVRASFVLILISLFLATVLVVLVPQKTGSEFLFMFAPMAIIMTNYIETVEGTWFAELFLGLFIAAPIVALML